MKLFSYRWTAARGWHWKVERAVTALTAEGWLNIYQKDEPGVKFAVSETCPKEPT